MTDVHTLFWYPSARVWRHAIATHTSSSITASDDRSVAPSETAIQQIGSYPAHSCCIDINRTLDLSLSVRYVFLTRHKAQLNLDMILQPPFRHSQLYSDFLTQSQIYSQILSAYDFDYLSINSYVSNLTWEPGIYERCRVFHLSNPLR